MTAPKLSTDQIEKGWRDTFSVDNPFCPCDLKSFTKAVNWTLRALAPPSGEGVDKGPWHVTLNGDIQSDDFTVGATLLLSGDFKDKAHRLQYAEWLCSKLNTTPQSAPVDGDWYKDEATGSYVVDWDDDPQRQLSIMLKPDGKVAYAVYVEDKRFHGPDAMDPNFMRAIREWGNSEAREVTNSMIDALIDISECGIENGEREWTDAGHKACVMMAYEVMREIEWFWGGRDKPAALTTPPPASQERGGISCYVGDMKTSAGMRYYVCIERNGEMITPFEFDERYKAEYQTAVYDAFFNDKPKPNILDFVPHSDAVSNHFCNEKCEAEIDQVFAGLSASPPSSAADYKLPPVPQPEPVRTESGATVIPNAAEQAKPDGPPVFFIRQDGTHGEYPPPPGEVWHYIWNPVGMIARDRKQFAECDLTEYVTLADYNALRSRLAGGVTVDYPMVHLALNAKPYIDKNDAMRVWQLFKDGVDSETAMRAALVAAWEAK